MQAKVLMKNGGDFYTPIENLDNVKRMLAGEYFDIEYPKIEGESDLDDMDETELRAKYEEVFGKKAGNKSVQTMKKDIESKETN